MNSLIKKAEEFAYLAHYGQFRKFTGEEYISHPEKVAKMISDNHFGNEAIAAAWLHDVVEDSNITFDQIKTEFGRNVVLLVKQLTKPNIAVICVAEAIKLADIADNCRNIARVAPKEFAFPYLIKKKEYVERTFYKGVIKMIAETTIREQLNLIF